MSGRGTTSGRTSVMMMVGSVRYIPIHRVGEENGESNEGREGGWNIYGGSGEEEGGGVRGRKRQTNEKDRVM